MPLPNAAEAPSQETKTQRGTGDGGGAPIGNQNARKPLPSADDELIHDYPAQSDWIKANKAEIDAAELPILNFRDRALYSAFAGLTPERLMEKHLEFRYGLYVRPQDIVQF